MTNETRLTVIITTYNLENYIEECLNSIISQKTNFKYQILVSDDSSKDKTIEKIRTIENKYPNLIRVLTSDRNLGSLANSNRAFGECKTEYFVFTDGDDYWLSSNRLQIQVDFLDNNPDYSMCGGNTLKLKGSSLQQIIPTESCISYHLDDYINGLAPFVHTSSIVHRNHVFSGGVPDLFKNAVGSFFECAYRGEDARFLLNLRNGKLKIFNEMFSVYRIHDKGLWQGSSEFKRKLEHAIQYFEFSLRILPEARELYEERCKNLIRSLSIQIRDAILYNKYEVSAKELNMFLDLLREIHSLNYFIASEAVSKKSLKRILAEKLHNFLEKKLFYINY